MLNQNLWIGAGRLTKDPEFVPAGKGDAHITFTLAVNRVVPRSSGPVADYMPCSFWGGEEELKKFCEEVRKGDEVAIVGRIYTSSVATGGRKRQFFWEIRVEEVQPGARSLKNLAADNEEETAETRALGNLHKEFSG